MISDFLKSFSSPADYATSFANCYNKFMFVVCASDICVKGVFHEEYDVKL